MEGSNPSWNQNLVLNVVPKKDPKSETSHRSITMEDIVEGELAGELLYLNLFDELTYDMNLDDRDRKTMIHKRIERNWLGSVSIPFSTIHERVKIDGVFTLQMPPVTLGYERDKSQIENAVLIGIDTTTNSTLVHLFITMEPPLPQPSMMKLHFSSREEDIVLRYINTWQTNLSLRHVNSRGRLVLCTALDLDGNTTLVTRFVKPQNPPSGPYGSSVERIIRFVSRVPYLPSRVLLSADGPGLWSTTNQLLEIRAGDGIEHATLLCNLLLGLNKTKLQGSRDGIASSESLDKAEQNGKKSKSSDLSDERRVYVVLGKGYEGNVAYVLLKERVEITLKPNLEQTKIEGLSNSLQRMVSTPIGATPSTTAGAAQVSTRTSFSLINPVTGESYSAGDPHIPLKEIGCIFNDENMWANIQQSAHPGSINWDLNLQKCWVPLITRTSPKIDLASIQVGAIR